MRFLRDIRPPLRQMLEKFFPPFRYRLESRHLSRRLFFGECLSSAGSFLCVFAKSSECRSAAVGIGLDSLHLSRNRGCSPALVTSVTSTSIFTPYLCFAASCSPSPVGPISIRFSVLRAEILTLGAPKRLSIKCPALSPIPLDTVFCALGGRCSTTLPGVPSRTFASSLYEYAPSRYSRNV